jgi:hypothetical protein
MTIRYISTKCLRATLLGAALFLTASTARLLADDPKPDPAGTSTGMAADAQAATGVSTFVVSAPSDLSADDKKDPAKVKAYNDAKKASDDFIQTIGSRAACGEACGRGRPQPRRDQLHLDPDDWLLGHVHAGRLRPRRDGSVPRQERGPHHGDELHDLPAGYARILHMRLRIHVWRDGGSNDPGRGRNRHLGRIFRPKPRARLHVRRPFHRTPWAGRASCSRGRATTPPHSRSSSSRWYSWTRPPRYLPGPQRNDGNSPRS